MPHFYYFPQLVRTIVVIYCTSYDNIGIIDILQLVIDVLLHQLLLCTMIDLQHFNAIQTPPMHFLRRPNMNMHTPYRHPHHPHHHR